MKSVRLIRQNTSLFAYLQIDNNIPRRFKIDINARSQISLETAQLLFTENACIDEINKKVVQNARILSAAPLLMKEYVSECTLFGQTFKFRFPIATKAGSEDIVGCDILALFHDFCIKNDEISFDHGCPGYTCNENYVFRKYENTNILPTMSHLFDDLRRNDKSIRKPYHSNDLVQLMDMALDNALCCFNEKKVAEAEMILRRIDNMFDKKIDFDCNYCSPFRYSPTGKFLYLKGMTALARANTMRQDNNDEIYRSQIFSDLLKASAFFLPEHPLAYKIQSALKNIAKIISITKHK